MLDAGLQPDYRYMDAAVATVSSGVRAGATVIIETTLPVGDTRDRYAERLAAATGLELDRDLFVAFSPERLYTGAVIRNLATYPKLVGGIGPNSTDRAAAFYASVLDAEVVRMSSAEAAELSKLADTTYRDINIAFANELAAYAGRVGVDVQEVIQAANSQPYSHIHQPGLGVGGHCIPVYPRFLLARSPEMELVELSRRINDGQVAVAVEILTDEFSDIRDLPVLVLGLTYREGVKELAYSRGVELVDRLSAAHARVTAWDPLLSDAEVEACGARPWTWGTSSDARAIVVQTADPIFRQLEIGWFPQLELLLDGRNSLRDVHYPPGLRVLGVRCPAEGRPPLGRFVLIRPGAGARRHGLRHAAAADQGRGAASRARRTPRVRPGRHGPALGSADGRRVLLRAGPDAAAPLAGDRRRQPRRADRGDARGPRAGPGG